MDMQSFSLFVASLALSLFCAGAFWIVGRTSREFKGVNWMAAAYLAGAVASLLRLLNENQIHLPIIFISNTLVLLVFVLLHFAVLRVLEPGGARPFIGITALVLQVNAGLFLQSSAHYALRVGLLSLLLSVTIGHLCFVIVRQGLPKQGRPASIGMKAAAASMVATLLLNAGFSVVRGILLGMHAGALQMDYRNSLQVANMVVTIVCAAGIALSFFWMTAEQLQRVLETQARIDGLTALLNRRAIESEFEREADRAGRTEQPLSIIMLDIDHFKALNDLHGHGAGDRMLTEVADALRHTIRRVDLLARMGGEEFVALLPETDLEQAKQIAERLRANIAARRVKYGTSSLTVTASFGVSTWCGNDFEDLLRLADAGLYMAKEGGRNRVAVGTP